MEKIIPTLTEVDAFELPRLMVDRLIKEKKYSEQQALDILREAKRMLYLHVVSKEPISPSLIVDDGWHEMLMFTRVYQKFADFIGAYIHHDPTPGVPDGGVAYNKTKQNYQKFFGLTPDPKYWG